MTNRGQFNSRLGFILAAAGSAVGLGNIWKFPFEVGAGGGAAFVLVYLFFAFVLCFPVMVAELAIGRKTQRNPVGAIKALGHQRWVGIGYLGLASGFLILSFYTIVAAWAFGYFVEILLGNFEIGNHFTAFTTNWLKIGLFSIVFMGGTAYVVSQGVGGGIERAAKILMPILLFFVLFLVLYALTLPHALTGIEFYLRPDFSKINGEVIYKALGQAFFSLSLGMGALITYGSYVSRDTDIVRAAAVITLTDVSIAFLAGLMMFPFVAYMTEGDLLQMREVSGGAGFIFMTLPGIFQSFGGLLGVIIGATFFLLLTFAAFTSTISLLEVPTAYMVDELKIERKRSTWIVAGLIYLVGIPSMLSTGSVDFFTQFITFPGTGTLNFMDFVGLLANDTFLPLGGLLISIFTAYVWRRNNFAAEIAVGAGKGGFLSMYVGFAISYVCPVILGVITLVTICNNFLGVDISGGLF
ncbi:MAG: sodium-dependent transporter [Pseudomonadales bacterium]|nr:sodium-dependent transporter [Pseudomonadales bacterium]